MQIILRTFILEGIPDIFQLQRKLQELSIDKKLKDFYQIELCSFRNHIYKSCYTHLI